MAVVAVGGRELTYVRRGAGEPLLLIQGMAGHHGLWGEEFLSLLARDFDVVAFDHRGVAGGGRVDEPFGVRDLAEDAVGVLDGLGWESAHVLGISLGGMVAQELVVAHPERVRSLVLGCTYAGPDGGALDGPGPVRMMTAAATRDVSKSLRAGYEANLSPEFRADEAEFERFVEAVLSEQVPAPVIALQMQAALQHDSVAGLADVRASTLVIHGTEDEMITPKNGDHVASLIPGARLEVFEGVGHLFWWERPERTAELVREHALGR
ncbi:alpha/beta hydrolase [Actinokineospora sp. PR83]|uniref:alpha/beta fold hydrolase n=1 Tax=Actinokineospora sp. PR83 TaxID=2884908 RepID=UPI0027E0FDF0|nr:alpha/beta hydrolase [Actinokineospora sp. PR83]MCG8919547.1 alpha/beta hydrolase [Actinokineospora sp. PR83]